MSGPLSRALAGFGLAVLLFAGGYGVGLQHGRSAGAAHEAAQQAAQARAVASATLAAQQEGSATLAALRSDLAKATQYQATLQEARRRVPLVSPKPTAPAVVPPTAPPGTASQPAPLAPVGPADEPELSLGAVSLWNSALAGFDVPAGACRAADAADPACAAGAGIGVLSAWDNQAVNAAACAADRQRLAALIHLLCKRPGQDGCPGANP